MGYLKGKSALMIFDRHPEYKNKGDRHFWAKGYYVDTVGRNEEEIKKYIKNQVEADMIEDNIKK
jgi:putative transposase